MSSDRLAPAEMKNYHSISETSDAVEMNPNPCALSGGENGFWVISDSYAGPITFHLQSEYLDTPFYPLSILIYCCHALIQLF
jgi:hypothetical protein